jgi:hypothetical protein
VPRGREYAIERRPEGLALCREGLSVELEVVEDLMLLRALDEAGYRQVVLLVVALLAGDEG